MRGHRGVTLWMTGLSGAGKSTVAARVDEALARRGCNSYVLDGDNVRHGLCSDLGFSDRDRDENTRRVAEVAKLFTDAGAIVLVAVISPFRRERDSIRARMAKGDFVEVYVRADVSACESRDPKGLYKKARAGEIVNFTGVSAPYEEPLQPEILIDTTTADVDACARHILDFLERGAYIPKAP